MKMQGGSVVVLCDYGQVLAGFDRSLCAVNFERLLGRPMPEAGADLLEDLLQPFEAGDLDADAFLSEARGPLRLSGGAEESSFREAWCSILWTSDAVVARMRQVAARPEVVFHVVTNTDPWRLEHASSTLGMADLFRQVTASFEPGVSPKGRDSGMWAEARRRAELDGEEAPRLVLGIDDLEANLQPALDDGTLDQAIVFTGVESLDRELQALGL
ncbi:MAG: HAD family hydrolase [Planctomycetota bacterium]|jgi:hypothetical protein